MQTIYEYSHYQATAKSEDELQIATQREHKIVDYFNILLYLCPKGRKEAEVKGMSKCTT